MFWITIVKKDFHHLYRPVVLLLICGWFAFCLSGEQLWGCPGFGQDRVNFHRTPGRGTAEGWGLTPPGQTEPGIPYQVFHTMCRHAGFRWGVRRSGNSLAAREGTAAVRPRERVCSAGLFCVFPFFFIVVVPVPFVCCSVKMPLSRPTSFYLFLSILLRTAAGGGAAACRFCCRLHPNQNNTVVLYLILQNCKPQLSSGSSEQVVSVVTEKQRESRMHI